ncbi:alpha/beta hydrolase [Mycolicibacterium thermoresistibile]
MSAWASDVLPGYRQRTLHLGPDPDGEGELVATLVRRDAPAATEPTDAVLLVHGFTDYFFNTEFADHFAARGFAFYAIDLHKCGRSRRPGQTPHFTTDLTRYQRDLDAALELIAAASPRVLICAHSAGGLIVSLWLDALRRRDGSARHRVGGLVLNSPFLDLQGPAILRTAATTAAIGVLSRLRKHQVVRPPTAGGYGTTLHRDYAGEFDYDLQWKPIGGFPVTAGWIYAIRRGHARLHRGLDVGVPNLILRSDHSVREAADPDRIQRGDAVLDVTQIARWAGCIGNRSTVIPIVDAKHDVFLSLTEPRRTAYRELDRWLDWYQSLPGPIAENPARQARHEQGGPR